MRCASAGTRKRSDWPGPVCAERAHADDVEAVREVRLQREVRRRDLAHAVRGRRAQRRVLAEREVAVLDLPVLLGAPDHDHAAHVDGAGRVEHVRGPFDVDAQDARRIGPRLADVRERREVVHDVGPVAGEGLLHGFAVGDVERIGARAVDRHHVVALGPAVRVSDTCRRSRCRR